MFTDLSHRVFIFALCSFIMCACLLPSAQTFNLFPRPYRGVPAKCRVAPNAS